jgi:hypothetical protein
MARLYINPGNLTYGPVPGGEVTEIFGSNQAEKVWFAANANVLLDPSFVRGNDAIVILGLQLSRASPSRRAMARASASLRSELAAGSASSSTTAPSISAPMTLAHRSSLLARAACRKSAIRLP